MLRPFGVNCRRGVLNFVLQIFEVLLQVVYLPCLLCQLLGVSLFLGLLLLELAVQNQLRTLCHAFWAVHVSALPAHQQWALNQHVSSASRHLLPHILTARALVVQCHLEHRPVVANVRTGLLLSMAARSRILAHIHQADRKSVHVLTLRVEIGYWRPCVIF